MPAYIGIDVSEHQLEVWDDTTQAQRQFPNTAAGIGTLVAWLSKQHPDHALQVILEPTSVYHQPLVLALEAQDLPFTAINPRRTATYAAEQGRRGKTDQADARSLAQMGREKRLPPSAPPEPDREQLKYLRRQVEWLREEAERARNRRQTLARSPYVTPPVLDSLDRTIQELEGQAQALEGAITAFLKAHPALQQEVTLVDSVKGIGRKTAVLLVSELPPAARCEDAKDWVAYSGLNPALKQSGKQRTSALSRTGPGVVRAGLYWPALAALRSNPAVRAQGERLEGRGKLGLQIIVAAMAKLVRQSFAVVKSGQPFDPAWQEQHANLPGKRLQLDAQHGI